MTHQEAQVDPTPKLIATICGEKHPVEIIDYRGDTAVRVRVTDGTKPFEFGLHPSDTGYLWQDRIEVIQ